MPLLVKNYEDRYEDRRHVQPPTQYGHHVSGKRIFIHAVNDIHSWVHLKIYDGASARKSSSAKS
jgi:hypothetical protein